MINPHLIQPKYKKFRSPRFAGGKVYSAFVGKPTRKSFRRASEAKTYAQQVHARWCRLYQAAIVELVEPTA